LDLSVRTINALTKANIRTAGGLAKKKEKDLDEIEGLGSKEFKKLKSIIKLRNNLEIIPIIG
jgi:DNA-directed RNA polymerase alpha subunit